MALQVMLAGRIAAIKGRRSGAFKDRCRKLLRETASLGIAKAAKILRKTDAGEVAEWSKALPC